MYETPTTAIAAYDSSRLSQRFLSQRDFSSERRSIRTPVCWRLAKE